MAGVVGSLQRERILSGVATSPAVIAAAAVLLALVGRRAFGRSHSHGGSAPEWSGPPLTAGEIRTATFGQRLRGYHPSDVDAFLARMADRVDAGLTVGDVASEVMFREKLRGYNPPEVDEFLARLASQ